MKKLFIIVIWIIILSRYLFPAEFNWSRMNLPALADIDGLMTGIHKAKGGNLYIGTVGMGIYKSTNEGINWTKLGSGAGSINVKCASKFFTEDEKLIYVFAYNLLFFEKTFYYTTDGGNVWQTLKQDGTVTEIKKATLFPNNRLIVLEMGTNKLFLSEDTCKTWKSLNLPSEANNGICDFYNWNNQKLYVATANNGIYYSDASDFNNWQKLNLNLPDNHIKKIALSADGRLFYCSENEEFYFQTGTDFKHINVDYYFSESSDEVFDINVLNNKYLTFQTNSFSNDWNTFDAFCYNIENDSALFLGIDERFGVDYSADNNYIYVVTNFSLCKAPIHKLNSVDDESFSANLAINLSNEKVLTINSEQTIESVEIYDLLGRLICSEQPNTKSYSHSLSIENPSVLILRVIIDGSTFTVKITY